MRHRSRLNPNGVQQIATSLAGAGLTDHTARMEHSRNFKSGHPGGRGELSLEARFTTTGCLPRDDTGPQKEGYHSVARYARPVAVIT